MGVLDGRSLGATVSQDGLRRMRNLRDRWASIVMITLWEMDGVMTTKAGQATL
jgi:hypothetical protein